VGTIVDDIGGVENAAGGNCSRANPLRRSFAPLQRGTRARADFNRWSRTSDLKNRLALNASRGSCGVETEHGARIGRCLALAGCLLTLFGRPAQIGVTHFDDRSVGVVLLLPSRALTPSPHGSLSGDRRTAQRAVERSRPFSSGRTEEAHADAVIALRSRSIPGAISKAPRGGAATRRRSDRFASISRRPNRCNLLCTTCPRTYEELEPPADISWELFTSIVDQIPKPGARRSCTASGNRCW